MLNRILKCAILLALTLIACGCPEQQSQDGAAASKSSDSDVKPAATKQHATMKVPIVVWADPLLKPALDALQPLFVKQHRAGWKIELVGRDELLARVWEGTESTGLEHKESADVYLLADEGAFAALRDSEWTADETLRTFAGDRVAVFQRADDRWPKSTLHALPPLQFKTFGLVEEFDDAGMYARQALVSEGVEPRLKDRIKVYDTTAELLAALKAGELDMAAGVASMLAGGEFKLITLVEEDLHEDIKYLAVASKGNERDPGVPELLELLVSPEGQQALVDAGYVDRGTALIEQR